MNDEKKTPLISNDSNLIKLLKCPICKQFFNEPIECLICHNNFCKECLDNFNSKNTNNNKDCYYNCKDAKFILNRFLNNIIPELKNFELNQSEINNLNNSTPLIKSEEKILNPEYITPIKEIKYKIKKETNNFQLEAKSSERCKNELIRMEKSKNKILNEFNTLKTRLMLYQQFDEIEFIKNKINKEKNKYEKNKLKFEDYQDQEQNYEEEEEYLDDYY